MRVRVKARIRIGLRVSVSLCFFFGGGIWVGVGLGGESVAEREEKRDRYLPCVWGGGQRISMGLYGAFSVYFLLACFLFIFRYLFLGRWEDGKDILCRFFSLSLFFGSSRVVSVRMGLGWKKRHKNCVCVLR